MQKRGVGGAAARRANRVTSYDVARLAGVSQPTVSRAFKPGASIAKEKRDRVMVAAKQLRYVPNLLASNLTTARTNTISVIIGDMNNPFYAESLMAFIAQLQERDRRIFVFSVPQGGDPDDALLQALRYQSDGIVVTSAHLSSEIIALGETLEVPIVMFNRTIDGSPLPSVHCDNRAGAQLLADRMVGAGARSFLVVRGDPQGSTSRRRVEGFCTALDSHGIPRRQIDEIDGGSTHGKAYAAISDYFGVHGGAWPDAIFAANDIMAIGCADAVRHRFGRAIPDDVMLAGFDGIREGQHGSYRLTTMRQPIDDMVRTALDQVLAGMSDEGTVEPVLLPGTLMPGVTVPGAE